MPSDSTGNPRHPCTLWGLNVLHSYLTKGGMIVANEREEVVASISTFVMTTYGGDYHRAFLAYANEEGNISLDALKVILADAKIGKRFTRGLYANGIMSELDTDGNKNISWAEFLQAFTGQPKKAAE